MCLILSEIGIQDLTSIGTRVMNVSKKGITDMKKDYTLFGTKVFNQKSKTVGLLIYTWKNKFADGIVDYATCVDEKGKRYNIEIDNIQPLEDFE